MKLRFSSRAAMLLTILLAAALPLSPALAGDIKASTVPAKLAALPEAVTSFGAVTDGDWLYVFGGHKGERHEYSADMVSGSFHRLNVSSGGGWEALPTAPPGQGLALVAHNGLIYRVGGMAARNRLNTKQDLFSVALVQRFDPHAKRWDDVAPLPAPRSSHDAVVVNNKLYVAGGWQLTGGTNKPVWPKTALVLDLANIHNGWKEFGQPFQRRALALAASGAKVYCIGGMDSDNQTTLSVEVYDTKTGQWSTGPALPPGKHKGFGCSAITQNGRIFASAAKGELLRLSEDERSWEVVGNLQHPRMAHRLVTAGDSQVIALGGELGGDKTPDLEVLSPASHNSVRATTAGSATAAAQ